MPGFDKEYFTDGLGLYELVTKKVVRNAGLASGTLSEVTLRNCYTEDLLTISVQKFAKNFTAIAAESRAA